MFPATLTMRSSISVPARSNCGKFVAREQFSREAVVADALRLRSEQQKLSDERDELRKAIKDVEPWGEFQLPPRRQSRQRAILVLCRASSRTVEVRQHRRPVSGSQPATIEMPMSSCSAERNRQTFRAHVSNSILDRCPNCKLDWTKLTTDGRVAIPTCGTDALVRAACKPDSMKPTTRRSETARRSNCSTVAAYLHFKAGCRETRRIGFGSSPPNMNWP